MRRERFFFYITLLLVSLPIKFCANTIIAQHFPVVIVSDDGSTLTFLSSFSTPWGSDFIKIDNSGYTTTPSWCSEKVKKVIFDSSFSQYKSVSTAYWFCGCTNLETIEGLTNLRVDSVENMDYMFYGCSSLKILDLSGFDTYKLKSCYNMFSSCSQLETIYGNSWDILANMTEEEKQRFLSAQSNMSYANYMFYGCFNLVGGNGTKYNMMVRDDYKYTHIDNKSGFGYFTMKPSDLKAYGVANRDVLTFYYDTIQWGRVGHKYDVDLAEGEDWHDQGWNYNDFIVKAIIDKSFSNYSIPTFHRLFYHCYKLKSIEGLAYLNTEKVTDMSGMFATCCSLESLDLSGLNIQNVTTMSNMCSGCYSLETINLNNLNSGNVTNMEGLLYDCFNLKEINMKGLKTDKVISMNSMFAKCERLTTINLEDFNTSNVRNMSYMFYDCLSLSDLDISCFNTANDTTMANMFARCYSLSELDLSHFNTKKVKDMSYMFMDSNLEIVVISKPEPIWQRYRRAIHNYSGLPNSSSLVKLNISSFNTSSVTDMVGMFMNCGKLKAIYVGEGWNTDKVASSGYLFSGCTSLVGGDGTVFDENYTDKTKAYAGIGGYLTLQEDDLQRYLDSLGDTEDEMTDGVYRRQFKNNEWQSGYLPFALNHSDWSDHFEVAIIKGLSEGDYGILQALEATIVNEGTIEANTPFLIRAKAVTGDVLRVNVTSTDPKVREFAIDGTNNHYSIIGNYSKRTGLFSASHYRICDGWLNIPLGDNEVLLPYRWYLTIGEESVDGFDPGNFPARLHIFDGQSTDINSIKISQGNYPDNVYDMRGRHIEVKERATLPKGVYIINNKKVIIK